MPSQTLSARTGPLNFEHLRLAVCLSSVHTAWPMSPRNANGLHLIMGGHSHTPLGDFAGAVGKYPTIVENSEGEEVFIVQAYPWGEYIGYIDVTYDAAGRILDYHGVPIHLTNTTAQDEDLQSQIDGWRKPFEEFAAQVVGESKVVLDQSLCLQQECLLGNFMAEYIPFSPSFKPWLTLRNRIAMLLWSTLEGIMSKVNQVNGRPVTSLLQVSRGIVIEYNPDASATTKLVAVTIGGKPLDKATEYRIVTLDFLAGGGDNFLYPPFKNPVVLDTQDTVLVDYIGYTTPVDIKLEGRIKPISRCRQKFLAKNAKWAADQGPMKA